MSSQKIETLTWVLIYVGLLAFSLGWFAEARSAPAGLVLMIGGSVAAAVGIVLIFLRARRGEAS